MRKNTARLFLSYPCSFCLLFKMALIDWFMEHDRNMGVSLVWLYGRLFLDEC